MAYQCPDKDVETGLLAIFCASKEINTLEESYECFNVNIGSESLEAEIYEEEEEEIVEWQFTGTAHWLDRFDEVSSIPSLHSDDSSGCSNNSMPSLLLAAQQYIARHGEEMRRNSKENEKESEKETEKGDSDEDLMSPLEQRNSNRWQMEPDDEESDSDDDLMPPLQQRFYDCNDEGDSSDEESNSSDVDLMPPLIPRTFNWEDDDESTIDDCDEKSVHTAKTEEAFHVVNYNHKRNVEEWLIDSGATVNVTRSEKNVTNITPSNAKITVGNGEKVHVKAQGDLFLKENNTGEMIKIQELICPEFPKNILSTKKLLAKGHSVVMDNKSGYIATNDTGMKDGLTKKIDLDRGSDGMFYLKGKRLNEEQVHSVASEPGGWTDVAQQELDEKGTPKKRNKEKGLPRSMDFNEAHELWGHKCKGLIKKTAKYFGVKLTGTLDPCEGCGIAMAKQKAVSKTTSV
jgi:hypothetical protein